MTITKAELDQLRAERNTPNRIVEYTPGGELESTVKSCVAAEREQALLHRDRVMQKTEVEFRHAENFASREGLAKARFNHEAEMEP